MIQKTKDQLKNIYKIKDNVISLYEKALKDVEDEFIKYDEIREFNQLKVLNALQEERISDSHFTNSSGYGYGDIGRDALDRVYARVFNAESAIVRPHFVNGTHAIGAALFGNLRPNDTMLSIVGAPYDTLHSIIGIAGEENIGSLREYGVKYKQIDLENGKVNIEAVKHALKEDASIKLVHIQRSTGYGWRNSLLVSEIKDLIALVKDIRKDVICFVDNCYGEFIDTIEPTDVGADLIAGSLIKNIGGGIAPTGGYIVGKKEYVTQASYRLTIPGIGGECGSTFGVMRQLFQGLFLAPHISMEAVKGAILCSRIMELAGFEVLPKYNEKRSDIIQSIKFNNKEKLINFCKGIQAGSPIDSFVQCEPWDMPGYEDQVIMAAGAFIQGSSIELSSDAPIREPYIAYLQGGLTFDHAKIGILIALNKILNE
ncbi:cystathionine beta-lyase family protein involved in aluminum resistance [Clostridium tetanomorphum]|uniref:Methionine gamma-lyase family protein n=1 Tax=Clostridium tetanomorphum TaxID=1553 RepID=A0A923EAS2_CLOTT|nr:methionine gamma-lyase family protein [Clostridium tetanomorphum]KAJ52523.1 aluminum resistance protein [Clostridium tetanomorphum DSM 665]MBC2399797.1 methionine gamma-lyase family protein [Clostridium tetanomorphum]MBP1864202.1 cystathionine beta-lyase family protein involved in aluminum resistance [Clostridium tetanomorphum]NRS84615.1 cystathionine beta-lyase family protein involved in aluminum resistance [Clostridium tetanomorphum]NRZ97830.1 cystathionine beta-lyase family protein invol